MLPATTTGHFGRFFVAGSTVWAAGCRRRHSLGRGLSPAAQSDHAGSRVGTAFLLLGWRTSRRAHASSATAPRRSTAVASGRCKRPRNRCWERHASATTSTDGTLSGNLHPNVLHNRWAEHVSGAEQLSSTFVPPRALQAPLPFASMRVPTCAYDARWGPYPGICVPPPSRPRDVPLIQGLFIQIVHLNKRECISAGRLIRAENR